MSFEPMSAVGLRRELEQASVNLHHHLEQQKHHTDEVARWQGVVTQLEQTIALLESPASALKKKVAPEIVKDGRSGLRIRWSKEWPIFLGELMARGIVPTKRQLMVEIQARYQKSEAYSNGLVNKAINEGDLLLKQDHCYLPTANTQASVA